MTMTWQSFVKEHLPYIRRIAWRFARGGRQDDFVQELVLSIANGLDRYDPALSAPRTWIWWQARELKSKRLVHARRRRNETAIEAETGVPEMLIVQPKHETAARLQQAWEHADMGQREAMVIVAEGLTYDEVKKLYGVSHQAMQSRLKTLGRKLTREKA